MNTLDLDAWCRTDQADASEPWGDIHFRVSESAHLAMEKAEEQLLSDSAEEIFIPVNMSDMELNTPEGGLEDCKMRVFLSPKTERGFFHLVGHRPSDHALIYSNAVMVDQLG